MPGVTCSVSFRCDSLCAYEKCCSKIKDGEMDQMWPSCQIDSGNAVGGIHRRQSVAVIVLVINVIREIAEVAKETLACWITARRCGCLPVVVIREGSVREIVVRYRSCRFPPGSASDSRRAASCAIGLISEAGMMLPANGVRI